MNEADKIVADITMDIMISRMEMVFKTLYKQVNVREDVSSGMLILATPFAAYAQLPSAPELDRILDFKQRIEEHEHTRVIAGAFAVNAKVTNTDTLVDVMMQDQDPKIDIEALPTKIFAGYKFLGQTKMFYYDYTKTVDDGIRISNRTAVEVIDEFVSAFKSLFNVN